MSRPLPTLPLEIILEILRDYDLSQSDLARLCLVSRKILKSVRVTLYERIDVSFVDPEVAGQQQPGSDPLLDSSTWCLLRTLQDNPELSLLVQTIDFNHNSEDTPSPSRISLPIPQAVSLFLKLVPNFTTVIIREDFDNLLDQMLQVLRGYAGKIQELYIWSLMKREGNFSATSFPRLTKLAISHVSNDTEPDSAGLVPLQVLNIFGSLSPDQRIGLLEPLKSNLGYLCINAGAASNLDYSRFSQLKGLHLIDYESGKYALDRHARKRPDFNKFWSKLCQAPTSLKVLSFEGGQYEDGLEEDLFGDSIRTGIQLQNIRRIRFEGLIPLDRIARLIHASLLPNLRQIVVDYATGQEESTAERLSRIEAANTLCSTRGIDLLLNGWTG